MTLKNFNFNTLSISSMLKTVDDKAEFWSLYKNALKQLLEDDVCNALLKKLYKFDKDTFIHSCNVSVISAILWYNEKIMEVSLIDIVSSSLFHDIGKTMINKNILKSKKKLTEHEKRLISLHPTFGYNILKNVPISNVAKNGVLYHHSDMIGTGYPEKVTKKEPPMLAKILKIADVYDALVSKRSYKEEKDPSVAINYILDNNNIQFDAKLTCSLSTLLDILRKENSISYGY